VVLPALLDVRRDNKREKLLQYGKREWDTDSGSETQRIDATVAATRAYYESLGLPTRLSGYALGPAAVEAVFGQLCAHGMTALGERADVDLAAPGAVEQLKARLDARGISVDVLINNAGYGLYGSFLGQPLARTLDMMQLNMVALTALTHVFATDMARRGGGKILLVASIGAYQATPSYAAYSATKAYVLLFGEALHEELKGQA
jgi:NAD(P)-dependent dehydrogenase (short-subunit alcohol dehydrogenase family)